MLSQIIAGAALFAVCALFAVGIKVEYQKWSASLRGRLSLADGWNNDKLREEG